MEGLTNPAAADEPQSSQTDAAGAGAVEEPNPFAERQARLKEIDGEIVQADKELAQAQKRLADLRRERDKLTRQGLGPAVTAAEAVQAMVRSDQEQRMRRHAVAGDLAAALGGKLPTVRTPAEIAAMQTKRKVAPPKPLN
ncbi:MAG: hypothetical protein IT435_02340 [Phycisphaerales bacterium]|nr:hypothetical protein [Phycisphaerales bacterium]